MEIGSHHSFSNGGGGGYDENVGDDVDFKKVLIPVELNGVSYVLYFTGKEIEIRCFFKGIYLPQVIYHHRWK